MIYTVDEMAQKLGVPASTLRYYDKEGLLPFVERSSGGIRMFRENDFEWLQVIRCMKKAGMPIPQTQFADVPAITQHPLNRIVGHLPAH